jgi:hypothetical protein
MRGCSVVNMVPCELYAPGINLVDGEEKKDNFE